MSPEVPAARERPRPLLPLDPRQGEAAVAQLARQTVEGGSVPEVLRTGLSVLHVLLEAKTSFVVEFQPGEEQLNVTMVRGRNDLRIAAATPGSGAVGMAFSSRQLIREPPLFVAPLLGAEGTLGCLVFLSPKFDTSDLLLQGLAAQFAAGWEFARLRDEMARRNKDLQTAVAGLKSLEKSREELLSHVSHGLKNPLTTIKAYLAMLGQEKLGPLSDKAKDGVEICNRNADRLLRMISDLLLISRLQSGKMELSHRPFGIKAVLEEVLQSMAVTAERAKVQLKLRRSIEVYVRGDRDRLAEALFNLIESAIHLTSAGQTVEVSVLLDSSGLVQITVKDSGRGMTADEAQHLFEAYHPANNRAARHRAGLGLPIVAKIIHLHGGQVLAQSKIGDGTTFRISLPAFAAAVASMPVPKDRNTGGILLVEDDEDCREVLQQVLEEEGYRVMPAKSAAEAKALLANFRPGLVLLDVHLQDGDGRSVLHLIRQTRALSELSVYLMSGSSAVADLAAGTGIDRIDGFLEKPLQLPKLLATVASVVRPTQR